MFVFIKTSVYVLFLSAQSFHRLIVLLLYVWPHIVKQANFAGLVCNFGFLFIVFCVSTNSQAEE